MHNTHITESKKKPRVGAHGVRLKRFEEVVADLLSEQKKIQPHFVQIPPRPKEFAEHHDWPFGMLPVEARVMGNGKGQIKGIRATRKENQIRSMIQCVLALMNGEHEKRERKQPVEIVDFGGGSGHLAIPLALMLPEKCNVTIVDLKAASLQLVHDKARRCGSKEGLGEHIKANVENNSDNTFVYPKKEEVTQHDHIKRRCNGIPNLFTFHGSIESYDETFDIGVSLHACGEASDLVLRACGETTIDRNDRKACIVMAPCCVGKLNGVVHNPYVYHATGENRPTVKYPQSLPFCQVLSSNTNDCWNALAKAADYSDWNEMRSVRNASRRTAKALLETDRLLFLQEKYNYQTALTRMDPWEASPKHDILLAWPSDQWSPFQKHQMLPDIECQEDIEQTRRFLLGTTAEINDNNLIESDLIDWTLEERKAVETKLRDFVNGNEKVHSFPKGMGSRKRKLVHYVAHQMGLSHWCGGGKKDAEKIVIVGKNDDSSTFPSR